MDSSVLFVCECSHETLSPYFEEALPYLHDSLFVLGRIEALLWFFAFWLVAWLLYKLIRVFV